MTGSDSVDTTSLSIFSHTEMMFSGFSRRSPCIGLAAEAALKHNWSGTQDDAPLGGCCSRRTRGLQRWETGFFLADSSPSESLDGENQVLSHVSRSL